MDQPTEPIQGRTPSDAGREGSHTCCVWSPRAPRIRLRRPARLRRNLGSESGQGVVEFAAVLPLLAMLIWAAVLFGKALYYYIELTHVANEGARLAAVNQPQSGSNLKQILCNQFGTNSELYKGSGTVTPVSVTVSYPGTAGSQIGQPVKVDVSTSYHWFPFMGLATFTIDGSATMRLEQATTGNALVTGGTCS